MRPGHDTNSAMKVPPAMTHAPRSSRAIHGSHASMKTTLLKLTPKAKIKQKTNHQKIHLGPELWQPPSVIQGEGRGGQERGGEGRGERKGVGEEQGGEGRRGEEGERKGEEYEEVRERGREESSCK